MLCFPSRYISRYEIKNQKKKQEQNDSKQQKKQKKTYFMQSLFKLQTFTPQYNICTSTRKSNTFCFRLLKKKKNKNNSNIHMFVLHKRTFP